MNEQKMSIFYNGYEIEAAPQKLLESDNWTVNIYICKSHGSHIASRNFFCNDAYATKEETIKHCFNFGKQIIDGKISNYSVNGL